MSLLVYIIAYPLLWLISILPFNVLYGVSDMVFIIIYHLIGYRKKVVRSNLKLAFPDKEEKELLDIERRFYKHMCDMFLEMIKTMSISEAEMQKRFVFENLEVMRTVEKEKSVMLMFPHYASWEWVIALNQFINSKGYAVYKRISNSHFDRLMRNIREKFGTTLIEMKETPSIIRDNQKNNIQSMYGFLSDQSPQGKKINHWDEFMGVKIPVHTGAEVLAKRLDMAVMYLKVEKLKRGHYKATFKTLAVNPKEFDNYKITNIFLREVESQIKENPAYYFWTHKRWKHKDKYAQYFPEKQA